MFWVELHIVPVIAGQVHKVDPTLDLRLIVHIRYLRAARNVIVQAYSTFTRDCHKLATDGIRTCYATLLIPFDVI